MIWYLNIKLPFFIMFANTRDTSIIDAVPLDGSTAPNTQASRWLPSNTYRSIKITKMIWRQIPYVYKEADLRSIFNALCDINIIPYTILKHSQIQVETTHENILLKLRQKNNYEMITHLILIILYELQIAFWILYLVLWFLWWHQRRYKRLHFDF